MRLSWTVLIPTVFPEGNCQHEDSTLSNQPRGIIFVEESQMNLSLPLDLHEPQHPTPLFLDILLESLPCLYFPVVGFAKMSRVALVFFFKFSLNCLLRSKSVKVWPQELDFLPSKFPTKLFLYQISIIYIPDKAY